MLVTTLAPSHPAPSDAPSHPRTSHLRTVELVSDYAAFVDLEPRWNEAVQRASVPYPFLRHEWVRSWWDAFGGNAQLHILVVKAGEQIVAIAPLLRETARMYGVPVSRVRFLANDHTPRTDFIVADPSEETYRAIWDTLRQDDSWDLLQLNQVVKPSVTLDTFSRFAAEEGLSFGTWPHSDSPYLTLTGTWEQYFNSLSAKFRSNIRNRMTRLTRHGEPVLEVLRERTAIEGAYADALRLETSGWKAEEGTSICSDPSVERFYALLTERATERGWLELLFLTVGGRRIATSYGSTYGGRLFLFKTGYDPELATCAPFKLLTYFAIRHAYERGLGEVDFLGDAEPWKLEWTPAARSHDWLFVFANTRRARLLHSIKFQWGPELKRWRA
jgi:CelD/BcsL family acetyltransferase involved in cellulose biosynthesis